MKTVAIHSANNDFQHIEVLKRNRTARLKAGTFFVEGVRLLNAAKDAGWTFEALYCDATASLSSWAKEFFSAAKPKTLYKLAPELMQQLSDKEDTSELIAAVTMRSNELSTLRTHTGMRLVIFDRPSNPGNLGSIVRSCNAFGIDAVIVTGHAVDIYDTEVLRSSVGTFFFTPVIRIGSPKDLFAWLGNTAKIVGPIQLIGTSAKAATDLPDFSFTTPFALVIGNETDGMSRTFAEAVDVNLRIPMCGEATSLNVSSALSILLYESSRIK